MAEKVYLELLQRTLDTSNATIREHDVAVVFDDLKSVEPSFLFGSWTGGAFNTGHPGCDGLRAMGWAGKTFRSVDDVDPIMVWDQDGKPTWLPDYGHARIREVKYRGVISAAMVYDDKPIIDHFRYVDANTVAGVMDTNMFPQSAGMLHFYLRRTD